jgi:hypothetical protein
MTPGLLNLTCPQGATFTKTLTWKVGGTPVDLTGWTARMQVRTRHAAPETLVDIDSSAGITLGGDTGTITVALPATATEALPAGEWRYDLELEAADGTVYRLVEGAFTVTPEVTR